MIYQSDRMRLICIQTLLVSECNDIYVCQDEKSNTNDRYLVLVLKSHDIIRRYIEVCASREFGNNFMIDHFSDRGVYVCVLPYIKRRPLLEFYMGESMSLAQSETVCSNLVLAMIQSGLPYPLLYLLIRQGQMNLNRDLSVYLSFELDLSELDQTKSEKDCVVECARILLSLFESKQKQKAISYTLLEKKINSFGYTKFTELYKDITIAAVSSGKLNIVGSIKALWNRTKDNLFQLLLVACVFLIFIAGLSLISQMVFGDVPWLSVLFNNFKQIGTESLLQ